VTFAYRYDSAGGGGVGVGGGTLSGSDHRAARLLTVELHAPLTLKNRLPCNLTFALACAGRPFNHPVPRPGEGVAEGTLPGGGDDALVRAAFWDGDSLELALRFGTFHWVRTGLGYGRVKSLCRRGAEGGGDATLLLDFEERFAPGLGEGGRVVTVGLLLTEPSPGRVHAEVFAKHWVLDRTGLGLTLGSKGALTPFKPKQPGSVATGHAGPEYGGDGEFDGVTGEWGKKKQEVGGRT